MVYVKVADRGKITKLKKPTPSRELTRKYPWNDIRRDYIEGWKTGDGEKDVHLPNMREISDRHNTPYQRVRERSSKERWPARRQEFQMVITRERQKKHAKKLAENSIEFDSSSFNVAKLGIAMVTTRLAEVAQGVQQANILRKDAIRRQSEGEHVEKWELYPHVNYREMDGLASAAARFQEIGMRALGTDIQKHEITGADGNPIEMTSTSIITELNRDDPERLAMLILALRETGLAENMFSDDEIIDGVLLPMEGDEVAPPHVREDNNDDTNDNN